MLYIKKKNNYVSFICGISDCYDFILILRWIFNFYILEINKSINNFVFIIDYLCLEKMLWNDIRM